MRIITTLTAILALSTSGVVATAAAPAPELRSGAAAYPSSLGGVALTVTAEPVVDGLSSPVDIASPTGSTDLYIAEQCGRIRVFDDTGLHRVGSIAARVRCDGEQGLLSLAFHPNFAKNGRLLLYFSRADTGDIQVAQVRLENRRIVAGSYREILRIRHRQAGNHNGGRLVFDGHGLLFISVGDGGGGGNVFGHAQDHHSLLGKILRIDVNHERPYSIPAGNPLGGSKGRGEVWAIGLRNPWRMTLDPVTHSLWIGDVGQDAVEEVDQVRVGDGRLRNFGWSRFEGNTVFDASERLRGGRLIAPVHTYRHPEGESVIGGAVYRGTLSPTLKGHYVYGDLNGWISGFDLATPGTKAFTITPESELLTLAKAANGELYAGYASGAIYHLVAS